MIIKNKKILITSGPTWVPIDTVRVISNTASGETGSLLAGKISRRGGNVTLLQGPAAEKISPAGRKISIKKFRFFDELESLLKKELKSKEYDFIIHSAAVSDYKVKNIFGQKIGSNLKNLKLNLVPTPKLLDLVKKLDPKIKVCAFKLEINSGIKHLIKEAELLMKRSNADLIVANTFKNKKYNAYILNNNGSLIGPLRSKQELSDRLIKEMELL